MILVQELSRAKEFPQVSGQGHRVYASDLQEGMLRLGIIVNNNFSGTVHNFEFRGRACCLDFDWEDSAFRCVSAHLHPGGEKSVYSSSLDDLRHFLNSERLVVIGSDTQDALGRPTWSDWGFCPGRQRLERTTICGFPGRKGPCGFKHAGTGSDCWLDDFVRQPTG